MSDEATDSKFAKAESPDEGLAFAVDQLAKGVREHDNRECLIEAGYTANETEEIIQHATSGHTRRERERRNRVTGGGVQLIVGALGLWLLTYFFRQAGARGMMASIIFLGLDILGLVLIIKGVIRLFRRLFKL